MSKIATLVFCFLICQISFGQKAFIHGYYDKCDFFKELTQKEIKNCVTIKKNTSSFEIIFNIPLTKDLEEFIEIKLTTFDTKFQKYGVGHDADDWLEIGEKSHTGSILVNFKTNCGQKETYSGVDSSGFIDLTENAQLDLFNGYFRANIDGTIITGAFKNIKIN